MRATIPLGDIVRIRKNILLVGIVPLQGNLDGDAVFFSLRGKVEQLVHRRLVGVQIINEGSQSALILIEF